MGEKFGGKRKLDDAFKLAKENFFRQRHKFLVMNSDRKESREVISNPRVEREFIFGGTFDPIHHGHLAIIESLLEIDRDARVRVIPCAVPALKNAPSTSFNQRLEMLTLALSDQKRVLIDSREAQRAGPSFTIDTLTELKSEMPTTRLALVMGADSILDIEKWYQWQAFAKTCHLIVVNRPGIELSAIERAISISGFQKQLSYDALKSNAVGQAFYYQMPEKSESSTQIRDSGSHSETARFMLPESVIEYIRKNRLYTGENS